MKFDKNREEKEKPKRKKKKRTAKDRMKEQLPRPFNVIKPPSREMQNWLRANNIKWL